jgi:phytoene synthase
MAGEIRLQWWRDALAGKAAGAIASHPVALALVDTINRCDLPLADLEQMFEARAFDLYDDPMPSREVFASYLRATASMIFILAGKIISGDGTAVDAVAERAGPAYGITGLLRAFPLHASRRQTYLPADLLNENGADQELMLRGQSHAGLLDALAELRNDAREHLIEARRLLPAVTRETRSAFLPLALVECYLERMDRSDYDPFRTPVEIPQWRRQWLLWRAARKLR